MKLTKESPGAQQPDGQYLLNGPAGWRCEGKGLVGSPYKPPTVSGNCQSPATASPGKAFIWQIGEEHISH